MEDTLGLALLALMGTGFVGMMVGLIMQWRRDLAIDCNWRPQQTSEYTVVNFNTGDEVLKTDSLEEALKTLETHEYYYLLREGKSCN